MNWYVISVYIHILAAVIWIGGMLFLGLVLVPIAQALQPPGTGAQVIRAVGRRFRPIAWLCIGVLLVTGAVNLYYRGYSLGDVFSPDLLDTEFGRILAAKLGMVLSVVLLSAIHDFILGPRVARLMEAVARSGNPDPNTEPSKAALLRRRLSVLARLNALLALAVLALAVMLVRGLP